MRHILTLLLLCGSLTLQAQTSESPNSWTPDPLEDSIKKNFKACKYDNALVFAEQWLEKTKKNPGKDSLDYAAAQAEKGKIILKGQTPALAENCLRKAREIREKSLGPESPDLGHSLVDLGLFFMKMREYDEAKIFLTRAQAIYQKHLQESDPKRAELLEIFGYLYHWTDFYDKSEACILQAIELNKKYRQPNDPMLAGSFRALAFLYLTMGDFEKPKGLLQTAHQIVLSAFGEKHLQTAYSLTDLGIYYSDMGEIIEAEKFYKRALETVERILGREHYVTAGLQSNLGALYLESKQYAAAFTPLMQNINILRKIFGTKNLELAYALPELGQWYAQTGNYAKAVECYQEAAGIYKEISGTESAGLSEIYAGLSQLYIDQRKYREAADYFRLGEDLMRKEIRRVFPAFSEKNQKKYLIADEERRKLLKSFFSEYQQKEPEFAGELYNHQLFFKGLLLNTSARWKKRIKTSGDVKLVLLLNNWEKLCHQISKLHSSTDSKKRAGLDSLVFKADQMEKELSRRSGNYSHGEEKRKANWQDVQKALRPGEAVVEMIRYQKYGFISEEADSSDPGRPVYRQNGITDTIHYAALILVWNSAQPQLVLLRNGNDLESKWFSYYRNSVRLRQKDAESYRQFWQPISKKLKGIKKVWFSADGIYHKINLNTLQNPASGKSLMDEMDISLLGSGKDLLAANISESTNNLACLLGNPAFSEGNVNSAGSTRSAPDDFDYNARPDPSIEISSLPGTQDEIENVAGILEKKGWEIQKYTGKDALEERIKDMFKPRLLVFATHGIFQQQVKGGDAAMRNSGMLLSGAVQTLREGNNGEGEDGILTAYEAMNLNLDNTELVVLSACETGLGEIENGEGVYGLQRAFQVAGARNLIMSLWKVDDAVTKDLMLAFFLNWLGEGAGESQFARSGSENIRNAFRKAQLEIRQKHPEPYYWGGFVLLGK